MNRKTRRLLKKLAAAEIDLLVDHFETEMDDGEVKAIDKADAKRVLTRAAKLMADTGEPCAIKITAKEALAFPHTALADIVHPGEWYLIVGVDVHFRLTYLLRCIDLEGGDYDRRASAQIVMTGLLQPYLDTPGLNPKT